MKIALALIPIALGCASLAPEPEPSACRPDQLQLSTGPWVQCFERAECVEGTFRVAPEPGMVLCFETGRAEPEPAPESGEPE